MTVVKTKTLISVLELKQLLIELRDKRNNICIRFRMLGEMWNQNFMRIVDVTEKGVVLNDEVSNKLIFLQDLTFVMQFEIDAPFQTYQPHFHYEVVPYSGL
jgi:hypothetical protein